MKRTPLRRVLYVLIWLTALAPPIAALSYFLYADLLNPRSTQQIAEPYDGLYWDAAQFQIAFTRLENQVLLYKAGLDTDYQKVTLRYQILQSKLHVMSASTPLLSRQPKLAHWQQDELIELGKTIDTVGPDLDALPRDPARADQIVAELREHWDTVNDLAQSRRLVDVADRDALKLDFIAKRRLLFVAGLALLLLSAAATVLLVRNGVRRTKLIGQQHAALAAEHEATRAAREASLAKDTFLGMISHELRTPLHGIVSSIELLGFNFQTDVDRKVIRRLETAARHLEAQMRDLTDYARLGAGKLVLRDERFDPRALIESVVDENTQAASAKGLTLVSDAGDSAGLVESDPHRIRQIVSNLVTNAIRYTNAGTIRVQLARAPDALTISVSDTGPGVPQAQIPLLFKEFTQLDASRTRRFDGAGLGLTIVQELVELFGGTIRVASRVGEGTTFTVTIPVKAVAVAKGSGAAAREADESGRPRVLIVDDNPPIRESLGELLEHMKCSVTAAGNADEALRWLDTHRCDLVLVDLHMPQKDGYAFVAEFRERGGPNAEVPVIAVSAYAPEPLACGEGGPFFDYLVKPVRYDVLRGAVERACVARRDA